MIREREQSTGRHTPIMAMTAQAMKGDRERCLEAGMDAYLVKPVRARQLYQAIAELCGGGVPEPVGEPRPEPEPSGPAEALDWSGALEAVGGDEDLLRQVVAAFRQEIPDLIVQLEAAVQRGDAAVIRSAAHRVKGAIRTFGAQAATALAARLEELGRLGELASADSTFLSLRHEVARLLEELRTRVP
jgi:HPt (histidine-containing phosphotransfer) domain-containing protein